MSGRSSLFRKFARVAVGLACMASFVTAPIRAAAQPAQQAPSLIRDTEIEEILRQDAEPIFQAAGLNPHDVTIHIVADHELNAFTAGGQSLYLNTGLIIEAENPNQLIGVIAHETGHIAGGHI